MSTMPDSKRGTPGWLITPARRVAAGQGGRAAIGVPPDLFIRGRRQATKTRHHPEIARHAAILSTSAAVPDPVTGAEVPGAASVQYVQRGRRARERGPCGSQPADPGGAGSAATTPSTAAASVRLARTPPAASSCSAAPNVPPPFHPLRGESRDGRDRRQRVPMHTRAALPAIVDCVANRDGAGSRIRRGGVLRPSARPAGRAASVMAGTMHRGACREESSSRSTLALGVDGGRRPGVCRAPDAPPPAGFSEWLSSFMQDGPI